MSTLVLAQQQYLHHPALWVRLCGFLAPIASVVVGLSPFPTVHRIVHDGKVGDFPLLPYTVMIISATMWFAYGLLRGEAQIWACNGIALVMGLYYLLNYIRFAHTASTATTLPGTVEQHIHAALFTMMACVLWTILQFSGQDPAWLIGKVGMVFGVLLFASPLTVLRVVIETKSALSIPLPFTIASTINCFLWSVSGLWQLGDPNIYIPNLLGLGFSLAQLALKVYYQENLLDEIALDAQMLTEEEQEPIHLFAQSPIYSMSSTSSGYNSIDKR